MPYSTPIGKDEIQKLLEERVTSSTMRVIDLGCGSGTYGRLMRGIMCHKIGVDAVDYIHKFHLRRFYEKIHVHDIRDADFLRSLGHFHIAIAGDVLEHMTVEEAQSVLATMQEIADMIIVAVPYKWEQHMDNKWEEHIQDDLTPHLMQERYPSLKPLHMWSEGGTLVYGYYIWER